MTHLDNMSDFYKKRIISIFPIYWIVALIYIIVKRIDIIESIILAPIEFLGIQSVFTSLFSVSHNNGTWFISCIAISYLLFPFFRCIEFTIGVLLASVADKISSMKICVNFLFHWISALIEFIVLIVLVSVGIILNFGVNNYMMYNFICIPLFSLILITLAGVRSEPVKKSSIINYMSSASYTFFLAQLFFWQPTSWILRTLNIDNNYIKILLSFLVCTAIAVFLHSALEKPITRFLNKKFIK